MTTFAVITPTIGSDYLKQCIQSLEKQNCIHHLFVDGNQYIEKVHNIVGPIIHKNLRIHYIQDNIGKAGGNWYGHRIYAAASFLVNQDVICYMDEENWANSYYIQGFERALHNHQWAYTLRTIYSKEGEEVCPDNCESLGKWPVYGLGDRYHIDTSCFAIPRTVAVQVGHSWYGQYAADRQFFANLKHHFPNFNCTKKHTVNYRLEGSETSVTKEFFEAGNKKIQEIYGDKEYPWHETIQKLIINTSL
jgi:hypothetical protein